MKILLLAPQPFYQERGTPIAVDLVLRALSARGDRVDVLTYHEGSPVSYPHVRVLRIPRLPLVRRIGPGPSLKKLVCDAVFCVQALRLVRRGDYDLVHAVEESVFVALIIKRLCGIPYLYDMDSCLSEQLMGKYRLLRWIGWWLQRLEAPAIRAAEVIVPVCDALAEIAARSQPRQVVVLRDISLVSLNGHVSAAPDDVRRELGASGPLVMYIGNLERYQGMALLLDSFALAMPRVPTAHLVIVGGQTTQIRHYEQMATRLGLDGAVHFVGPRPVSQMAAYLAAADVLVSPRLQGHNTPMKIYSYLDSGKAVLATDLPTHTQVLTQEVALLRAPRPEAFAEGLVRLLQDSGLRQRLGEAGRRLITERHSYPVFEATVRALYDSLELSAKERTR